MVAYFESGKTPVDTLSFSPIFAYMEASMTYEQRFAAVVARERGGRGLWRNPKALLWVFGEVSAVEAFGPDARGGR
jgi:hypothetical protein